MTERRGIAMITVIGVLALASVLALAAAADARAALGATRHRIDATQAHWLAQGCAAHVLAALDERWAATADGAQQESFWRRLDMVVSRESALAGPSCLIRLEPAGTRLDLAQTSAAGLERLVTAVNAGTDAGLVARTILAWRDSLATADPASTAGPLRSVALRTHLAAASPSIEAAHAEAVAAHLAIGTGPVDLGHAPVPVLAALPGFTLRSAYAITRLREHDPGLRDVRVLLGALAQEDAAALTEAFEELSREATFVPATWVLRVTVRSDPAPGRDHAIAWRIGRAEHLTAAPEAP